MYQGKYQYLDRFSAFQLINKKETDIGNDFLIAFAIILRLNKENRLCYLLIKVGSEYNIGEWTHAKRIVFILKFISANTSCECDWANAT